MLPSGSLAECSTDMYSYVFPCNRVSSHMCPRYIPPPVKLDWTCVLWLVLRPWGLDMLNKYFMCMDTGMSVYASECPCRVTLCMCSGVWGHRFFEVAWCMFTYWPMLLLLLYKFYISLYVYLGLKIITMCLFWFTSLISDCINVFFPMFFTFCDVDIFP